MHCRERNNIADHLIFLQALAAHYQLKKSVAQQSSALSASSSLAVRGEKAPHTAKVAGTNEFLLGRPTTEVMIIN